VQNPSQSPISAISLFVPSLDDTLEGSEARRTGSSQSNAKWKPGWAMLFIGGVSLTLWSGIGALAWFVIRP
jgi:hypothetical protein